jgi:hypothetical protein
MSPRFQWIAKTFFSSRAADARSAMTAILGETKLAQRHLSFPRSGDPGAAAAFACGKSGFPLSRRVRGDDKGARSPLRLVTEGGTRTAQRLLRLTLKLMVVIPAKATHSRE